MHSIERARSLRHRFVLCIIVVENRSAGHQQPSFCTIFRRKFRLVKVVQNSNWMSYLVSYFQQRMHRNHLFLCCATFLYSKVPKTDFESKTRKIFTSPNGRWEPKLGLQPGPPPKSPKIHTCGGSPQLLKSLKCFWGMKFACINALLVGFHWTLWVVALQYSTLGLWDSSLNCFHWGWGFGLFASYLVQMVRKFSIEETTETAS